LLDLLLRVRYNGWQPSRVAWLDGHRGCRHRSLSIE
jgi:hypothetical protein